MKKDLADALSQIEAEREPPPELIDWAAEALVQGESFESVQAELVGQGWSPSSAERAVELARVQTRAERGVVTRADVVRSVDARYRRSTTGMANFYRAGIGPLGVVAFAIAVRQSLAALMHLGRLSSKRDGQPPVDKPPQI